jgi:hypothetical protein
MDPLDVMLGLAGFFLVLWVIYIGGFLYERRQRRKDRSGTQELP